VAVEVDVKFNVAVAMSEFVTLGFTISVGTCVVLEGELHPPINNKTMMTINILESIFCFSIYYQISATVKQFGNKSLGLWPQPS
jgi:hypothetical protein